MLKALIALSALVVLSASAFAAPSWYICKGPNLVVKFQDTAGHEELYLGQVGSTSESQVKITNYMQAKCPHCFAVEAENPKGKSKITLGMHGIHKGADFIPEGTLTIGRKVEKLSCEYIYARNGGGLGGPQR